MRNRYSNWADVLNSNNFDSFIPSFQGGNDHNLKQTRLEEMIFNEMLTTRTDIGDIIRKNNGAAPLFHGLIQDVFTAMFSLSLRHQVPEELFLEAATKNRQIVDELIKSPEYSELNELCKGKELPAFDACIAFSEVIRESVAKPTDALDKFIEIMKLLQQQTNDLNKQISRLCQYYPSIMLDRNIQHPLIQKALALANKADKKKRQMEDVREKIKECLIKQAPEVKKAVSEAAQAAIQKASETVSILTAWGDGSGEMQNMAENRELLQKAQDNPELKEIAKSLGRYREMLIRKRKTSYAYGLGEKYDITGGNDLGLCLSSEMSLLGTNETQPLFLHKYYQKSLKQYRKRNAVSKGDGDIIVCIDESSSTSDIKHWCKAFALALLDIAIKGHRKFAMIHFASRNRIKVDIFEPGKYTAEDVMNSARHFFGGGTDFEQPLSEAIKLIQNGFEKADISFITDGDCRISDAFTKSFNTEKMVHKFTVTGILIDDGEENAGESLIPFCDTIYKTSDMSTDEIALQILNHAS